MVMDDNDFEIKENKISTKDKMKPHNICSNILRKSTQSVKTNVVEVLKKTNKQTKKTKLFILQWNPALPA